MIDSEIIIPLKCLVMNESDCKHCKLKDKNDKCSKFLFSDVLGLIDENNRQKAEIERLTERVHFLCGKSGALQVEIQKYQTDVEQWKEEANRYQNLWCEDVQIARAEAVKEFAERLKESSSYSVVADGDREIPSTRRYSISESNIDEIVKEMVGDG